MGQSAAGGRFCIVALLCRSLGFACVSERGYISTRYRRLMFARICSHPAEIAQVWESGPSWTEIRPKAVEAGRRQANFDRLQGKLDRSRLRIGSDSATSS